MRTLPLFNFIFYCTKSAIRHPKSRIAYFRCRCGCRFPASLTACPKCGDEVKHSPERREEATLPWYGSVLVIIIGIICWVLGAGLEISGLCETGRAMVYLPLGNLFGLSLQKVWQATSAKAK
ncbi:MAG TPA: hypothetical protein VMV84_05545 [Dehalococcoidales bacterium]|nr:hypothetical protein [Dehalococcoidales bacterium]